MFGTLQIAVMTYYHIVSSKQHSQVGAEAARLLCSLHSGTVHHAESSREPSSYAAGVRYMFIGKLFEHRPSYHLLGVLLFIQLGITSASWAIRNVMQSPLMYGNAAKHAAEAQVSSNSDVPREQKAVVLEVSILSLSCCSILHMNCDAGHQCLWTDNRLPILLVVAASSSSGSVHRRRQHVCCFAVNRLHAVG